MSLRKNFRLRGTIPLICGIIITVLIPTIYLLCVHQTWKSHTKESMIQNKKIAIQQIGIALKLSIKFKFQKLQNYLILTRNWNKVIAQKNVTAKSSYDPDDVAQNLLTITQEANEANCSYEDIQYSGYYEVQSDTDLEDSSLQDIMFRPLIIENKNDEFGIKEYVSKIYTITDGTGLLYSYPLRNDSSILVENCQDQDEYHPVCDHIYEEALTTNTDLFMTQPFFNSNEELVSIACRNMTNYNDTTEKNTVMVTCIEYKMKEFMSDFTQTDNRYAYLINTHNYSVILHSEQNFTGSNYVPYNISQLEFAEGSTSEKEQFENTVLPKLEENEDSLSSYMKDGTTFYAFISKIDPILNLSVATNIEENHHIPEENKFSYSLVLIDSTKEILRELDTDLSAINRRIYIQSGIMIGIVIILSLSTLCLSNYIVKMIVDPLEDLIGVLRVMNKGNTSLDVNKIYKEYCYELNVLYLTFDQILGIIKYANDQYFSSSDEEAIEHYNSAMQLFKKLGNIKGEGVCASNIGNIYLKQLKYDEAIRYYKKSIKISLQEKKAIQAEKNALNKNDHLQIGSFSRNTKKEIETKKDFMIQQYCMRLYQLGFAYIKKCTQNHAYMWKEALKQFKKVLDLNYKNSLTKGKAINALYYLALIQINLSESSKAAESINKAQDIIEVNNALVKNDEKRLFEIGFKKPKKLLKIMIEIPMHILIQRIWYIKGVLCESERKFGDACKLYTLSIQHGETYDAEIRIKCINHLYDIFKKHNMERDIGEIVSLRENYYPHVKRIIFLIATTDTMKGVRIQKVSSHLVNLFENYLKETDEIGLITYNTKPKIIFDLKLKSEDVSILRNSLSKIKTAKGNSLFISIHLALERFAKHKKDIPSRVRGVSRKQWIIAVTDSEDNEKKIKFSQIKTEIQNKNTNLIILGINLLPLYVEKMKELCYSTNEGLYFNSKDLNEMDTAFQSICEMLYIPQF